MALKLISVPAYSSADDLPGKKSTPADTLGEYVECIQHSIDRYRDLVNFLNVSSMNVTITSFHVIHSTRCHSLLFMSILRSCASRLEELEAESKDEAKPKAAKYYMMALAVLNDAEQLNVQLRSLEERLLRENTSMAPVEDSKIAELSPLALTILAVLEDLCAAAQGDEYRERREVLRLSRQWRAMPWTRYLTTPRFEMVKPADLLRAEPAI
ncbi:MAG: hypothetical protein M1826_007095 [Phylliscum demangeonii]|nr:MAG: hypothetical protein M1826_007095 [Phylliscum demangeonii]